MTSDRDRMLLAVLLSDPGDLHAKLVCADALEEGGTPADASFAEYVRAWCELQRRFPHVVKDPDFPKTAARWANAAEYAELRARLSSLRSQHEASWRRRECPACEGKGHHLTDEYAARSPKMVTHYGCPACDGNGYVGPLSERIESNYDPASDTYRSSDWRHRVTWEPFPLVECTLAECGEERQCEACDGRGYSRRTDVYVNGVWQYNDDHTEKCPACKGSGRVWVPSPWAVEVTRVGGTLRVTDKEAGTWLGGTGDRAEYWWEPGLSFDFPRQIPFSLGEAGVRHGAWSVGFHGGLMVYVPPNNTPRDKGWDTADAAHRALSRALTLRCLKCMGWLNSEEVTT